MKKKKPLVSDLYIINQKIENKKSDNEAGIDTQPAAKKNESDNKTAIKPSDEQEKKKEEKVVYEPENDDPDCNWDYDACDAGDTEAVFVIQKAMRSETDPA